ncbi:hypothetical protein EBS02_04100 [bacterium]|nr:hypothetical protein [bacterium]
MQERESWKKLSTGEKVDLLSYLADWIGANPGYRIYIGCDSKNSSTKTVFVTVIVLHYPRGGGHVIFQKMLTDRFQDRHRRLWQEVELSVSTAQFIMQHGITTPDFIDIDLNPDPKYKSNSVLRSAVGLIESIGLRPRYKSIHPWAVSVADYICR